MEIIPKEEIDFSTSLIMGERTIEIPDFYTPLEVPTRPETIVLPERRTPADNASTAPCKHDCAIFKESQHLRQAHTVWKEGTTVQRALMLSIARQCGLDIAKAGPRHASRRSYVVVATMDRPIGYAHTNLSESTLYSASALNLHGMPYEYGALLPMNPPSCSLTYGAALTDLERPEPLHKRLFT